MQSVYKFYILSVYDIYILCISMKNINYNEDKRTKVLSERGIDIQLIAYMIYEWQIIDRMENSARNGQIAYVVLYNNYCCVVPCVEDDKEIFIKTAYFSRKYKKLYS